MIPDVLTLIVTYEGAGTVGNLLRSFPVCSEGKTGPLLVIDNASEDDTISVVKSLSLPRLEILGMPKNVGVSRAYNIGIERACQMGAEWLFILDQDTVCGKSCLDRLLQTGQDLIKQGEKVGAVCPTAKSQLFPDQIHYPYQWTGYRLKPILLSESRSADDLIAVDSTINSGTLYRVEALASINGFREEYFIDFVDHECHIRLRQAGWSIWWDKRAVLFHQLGKMQKITAEGLWIEHEPFRYYYMARNMTEGYWRLGGLRAMIHFGYETYKHSKRLRRYGSAPGESIRYILKGIKDSILGKFGPLDTDR